MAQGETHRLPKLQESGNPYIDSLQEHIIRLEQEVEELKGKVEKMEAESGAKIVRKA